MNINNLKRNAIFGISWTTSEYILLVFLQIIQLSVLARILKPEDFGIVAIANFFTTLGNTVFALGMGPALIQKKGEITEYLDTAWTANLIISIIATVFILVISPVIVHLYFDEPRALFPTIILISVVTISGLNNIGMVLFMKKIEMKKVFLYNALPKIIGVIISIIASNFFRNFWGLVYGIIFEYFSRMILSYILAPRKPSFKLDKKKFIELYSFGGWLQLKNIVSWASNNFDVAIIGALVNTTMLGFYNRASSLAKLPEAQINKVINVISFPLYSAVRDNSEQLLKAVKYNNDFVLLLLGPVLIITQSYTEELVNLLLGEGWQQLVPAFKYLVIAFSLKAYIASYTPLVRALGLSKFEFFFNAFKTGLMIILLYPLTAYYSIEGAALAILISSLIVAPFILAKIYKSTKLNFKKLFSSISVSVVSMVVLYFTIKLLNLNISTNFELIACATATIITYFLLLWLIYRLFKEGPFETILKALKMI